MLMLGDVLDGRAQLVAHAMLLSTAPRALTLLWRRQGGGQGDVAGWDPSRLHDITLLYHACVGACIHEGLFSSRLALEVLENSNGLPLAPLALLPKITTADTAPMSKEDHLVFEACSTGVRCLQEMNMQVGQLRRRMVDLLVSEPEATANSLGQLSSLTQKQMRAYESHFSALEAPGNQHSVSSGGRRIGAADAAALLAKLHELCRTAFICSKLLQAMWERLLPPGAEGSGDGSDDDAEAADTLTTLRGARGRGALAQRAALAGVEPKLDRAVAGAVAEALHALLAARLLLQRLLRGQPAAAAAAAAAYPDSAQLPFTRTQPLQRLLVQLLAFCRREALRQASAGAFSPDFIGSYLAGINASLGGDWAVKRAAAAAKAAEPALRRVHDAAHRTLELRELRLGGLTAAGGAQRRRRDGSAEAELTEEEAEAWARREGAGEEVVGLHACAAEVLMVLHGHEPDGGTCNSLSCAAQVRLSTLARALLARHRGNDLSSIERRRRTLGCLLVLTAAGVGSQAHGGNSSGISSSGTGSSGRVRGLTLSSAGGAGLSQAEQRGVHAALCAIRQAVLAMLHDLAACSDASALQIAEQRNRLLDVLRTSVCLSRAPPPPPKGLGRVHGGAGAAAAVAAAAVALHLVPPLLVGARAAARDGFAAAQAVRDTQRAKGAGSGRSFDPRAVVDHVKAVGSACKLALAGVAAAAAMCLWRGAEGTKGQRDSRTRPWDAAAPAEAAADSPAAPESHTHAPPLYALPVLLALRAAHVPELLALVAECARLCASGLAAPGEPPSVDVALVTRAFIVDVRSDTAKCLDALLRLSVAAADECCCLASAGGEPAAAAAAAAGLAACGAWLHEVITSGLLTALVECSGLGVVDLLAAEQARKARGMPGFKPAVGKLAPSEFEEAMSAALPLMALALGCIGRVARCVEQARHQSPAAVALCACSGPASGDGTAAAAAASCTCAASWWRHACDQSEAARLLNCLSRSAADVAMALAGSAKALPIAKDLDAAQRVNEGKGKLHGMLESFRLRLGDKAVPPGASYLDDRPSEAREVTHARELELGAARGRVSRGATEAATGLLTMAAALRGAAAAGASLSQQRQQQQQQQHRLQLCCRWPPQWGMLMSQLPGVAEAARSLCCNAACDGRRGGGGDGAQGQDMSGGVAVVACSRGCGARYCCRACLESDAAAGHGRGGGCGGAVHEGGASGRGKGETKAVCQEAQQQTLSACSEEPAVVSEAELNGAVVNGQRVNGVAGSGAASGVTAWHNRQDSDDDDVDDLMFGLN